jgi:hypothetical protein
MAAKMLFLTLKNQLTAKSGKTDDGAKAIRCETVNHVRKIFVKGGKHTRVVSALGLAAALAFSARATVTPDGTEYDIAVPLMGDQMHSDLALGVNGGYLVWDDNVGDGDGLSVNVRRITATLSGELNVIPLSTITAGHQERPRVSLLARGGAAFVWQSGPDSQQQIYTRTMNGNGVFTGPEVAVSAFAGTNQITAAVAGLTGGNYVVTWTADDQDGNMQGVFGALFGPAAQKLGAEFQVNQFTQFNQRNPAVTALTGGGFVVTWISEGNRGDQSADVYARVYDANGNAVGNEFRVNTSDRICSSPSIATTSTGNFTIAWCESAQDANFDGGATDGVFVTPINNSDGWDIYVSGFGPNGQRLTVPTRINQQIAGNQRNPRIATAGRQQLVVWSSFGQDGDWEGVIGRAVDGIGAAEGNEFIVNTGRIGRQLQPAVAGNGDTRFVVCWSTFTGLDTQVDLRAQRYTVDQTTVLLPAAGSPYVSALSQSRLSVTWPAADGYNVLNYELYIDGNVTPIVVTNQIYILSGLAPAATHTFEVAFRLLDGQLSPRSAQVTGTTWGEDSNADGLPDDWQMKYFGNNPNAWPSPNADSDGDGISNRLEFMAGTDPKDPNSALRTSFSVTAQGPRLTWNTVPGQMYQVEQTSDFSTWVPYGGQRFAPGTADSVSVPAGNSLGYYRVTRIR